MDTFKVERKKFLKALQNLSLIVRDSKTRPAISGILVDVKKDTVEIRSTDLEINIVSTIETVSSALGCFIIKLGTFQEYIRELPDKYIQLNKKDTSIEVKGESSQSEFNIYTSEDFPEYPLLKYEHTFELNSKTLLQSLENVMVGASNSSDNLAVNCVRMDLSDNKMKLVTSDGYRLFMFEIATNFNRISNTSIPFKTALVLSKLIKSNDSDLIKISRAGSYVFFDIGELNILSKVIELPYPDYESILSSITFDTSAICDAEDLTTALKRVQIFARENIDSRNGALFTFTDDKIILETSNENSNIKEEIPLKKEGPDIKIFLNVKFILDFLLQIKGNVKLELKDSNSAIFLKELNKENFICLAMPLAYNK